MSRYAKISASLSLAAIWAVLVAVPTQAAMITYLGIDATTGSNWIGTYGNDGYDLLALHTDHTTGNTGTYAVRTFGGAADVVSLPSYISGITVPSTAVWSGNGNFGQMQDPTQGGALVNTPAVLPQRGGGNITITRSSGDAFEMTIFVGVSSDGGFANNTFTYTLSDNTGWATGNTLSLPTGGNAGTPGMAYLSFTVGPGTSPLTLSFGPDPTNLAGLAFSPSPTPTNPTGSWATNGSGNWADSANWQPSTPGGIGATAVFSNSGLQISAGTVTVDSGRIVGQMDFSGSQKYTLSGDPLTIQAAAGNGIINLLSGSHQINCDVVLNNDLTFVASGGSMVVSGNISGSQSVGLVGLSGGGALTLGGNNTYSGQTTVSGGTLIVAAGGSLNSPGLVRPAAGQLNVAAGGSVNNAGAVNAVAGGVLNISGTLTVADGGAFGMGSGVAGTTGTTTVNSGAVLTIGGGSGYTAVGGDFLNAAGTGRIGAQGTGTFNINGGLVNVGAAGSGPGGLDSSRFWLNPYGGSNSTINLSGGTLSTARPIANGAGSPAYFNFNGGVLQAAADGVNILDAVGPLTVTLLAGGGTVDTNGFSTTFAPVVTGSGALTVIGSGTLTLAAANTYSGPTKIAAGTLALGAGGSIAKSSTIALANGTTLDVTALTAGLHLLGNQTLTGTGSFAVNGMMTVDSGATILPGGSGAFGTLSVGNLNLGTGSMLKYDFGSGQDLINVTASGGLNVAGGGLYLYQSDGSTQFSTTGTYTLVDYAGSLSGAANSLSVLNPAAGVTYTFGDSGGAIILTINPLSQVWNGSSGGPSYAWSNGANWASSLPPTSGNPMAFSGLQGLANNNDITGLNVAGITFNSSAGAFVLGGIAIQLSGAIINNSTATQTIGLNLELSGGDQAFNVSTGKIVVNGVVSDGDGSPRGIIKSGGGVLAITASNTYSGGTALNGGILQVGNSSALGSGTLSLNGGQLSAVGTAGVTLANPITFGGSVILGDAINNGPLTFSGAGAIGSANAQLIVNSPVTISSTISGSGGLTKSGPALLVLSGNESYTGATIANGGALSIAAGGSLNNTSLISAANGSLLTIASGGAVNNPALVNPTSGGTLNVAAGGTLNNAGGINSQGGVLSISGTVTMADNTAFGIGSGLAGTSGTTTVNSGAVLTIGNGGGYTAVGGDFLNAAGNGRAGAQGTGTFNINGGLVNVGAPGTAGPGNLDVSRFWLNPYGGSGSTINLLGGTLSTARPIANGAGNPAYFNFNGGILQAAADGINILDAQGPLTVTLLAGGGTLDTNGFSTNIAPVISGSGRLTVAGNGLLSLGSANTYSGGTIVAGGTLQLNNASALGKGGVTVVNGTLQLNNPSSLATVAVTLNGGELDLSTFSANVGSLSGSGGVVSDESMPSGVPTVLTVAQGTTTTFGGTIRDGLNGQPLALAMGGTGTLVLTGSNLYSGDTTINAGVLQFGTNAGTVVPTKVNGIVINGGGALAASGPAGLSTPAAWLASGLIAPNSMGALAITHNDASALDFNTPGLTGLSLGSTGQFTYSGTLTPGSNGYLLGGGGSTLTVSSPLGGANALTANGSVVLTGSNSYSGTTTVASGVLQLPRPAAIYGGNSASWTAANITVASGATLAVNVGGPSDFTTTNVGTLLSGITSPNGTGLQAGSTFGFDTTNSPAAVTFANVITDSTGTGGGAVGVAKLGSGMLIFAGANTYTGPTTVSSGTLQIGAAGHNGSVVGNIVNNASLVYYLNGSQLYSGQIKGSGGLTTTGTGTLMLSGNSTYSGPTNIGGGTLKLQSGGGGIAPPDMADLRLWLDASDGSTLQLSGSQVTQWGDKSGMGNDAVAIDIGNAPTYLAKGLGGKRPAISINGTPGFLSNFNLNDPNVTIAVIYQNMGGSNNASLFGHDAAGGWHRLQLVATGNGPNSYGAGGYNVAVPGMDSASVNSYVLVSQGGVTSGSNIYLNGSLAAGPFTDNNPDGTANMGIGNIDGSGGWAGNINISEVLVYDSALSSTQLTALNSYLNAWIAGVGSGVNLLPNTTPVAVAANASLDLNGCNQQVASLTGAGSVVNSNPVAPSVLTLSPSGGTTVFGGSILGGGALGTVSLVMNGSGTQVLSGNNTYNGMTTVSAGILQFTGPATLYNSNTASWTAANITVAGGATLAVNVGGPTDFSSAQAGTLLGNISGGTGIGLQARSRFAFDTTNAPAAVTFANPITDSVNGPLGITKLGAGTLVFTGSNTYTGPTTISGGMLQLGDGTAGHDGIALTGGINNNAALAFNLNGSQTYAGAIKGSGSLAKVGAGTLTLSGFNTYGGPTVVNGGTLRLQLALSPVGISYDGTQFDLGSVWRTDTVAKTYSLDHSNVLGNDGYYVVGANQRTLLPNYVTNFGTGSNGIYLGNAGYASIDDPATTPGSNPTTIVSGTTTTPIGNPVFTFILGNNVPAVIRLGVMIDGLDITAYNPGAVFVQQVGNPSVSSPVVATTSGNYNDRNPDWLFFDVVGAEPGSQIGVYGQLGINSDITLQAFSFDSGNGVLPSSTPLSIAAESIVDLNGANQQIASLSGAGVVLNSNSAASSVLTVNSAGGSTTFSGMIQGGGSLGPISLVLSGNGQLVLSGTNSYTGGTIVSGGTLIADSPYALPDGSSLTVGAGASSLFGTAAVGTGSAVSSGASVSVVPEPGTLALCLAGLIVACGVLRRKKRS
jgi:fibronectin-binding autotransporter adhesin